jgi:hypothetical protein
VFSLSAQTTAGHEHLAQVARAKNKLHGLPFIGAFWPRKIRKIFARRDPLIRIEQFGK